MKNLKLYENFNFNDDDFDEEEYDDSKDGDLVDAMIQITTEDFNDGYLDPYYELLGHVDNKILKNFLLKWNWDKKMTEFLNIEDNAIGLTEDLINNNKLSEIKTFFKEIIKNHREYAIGYLPEELWDEFE